MNAKKSSTIPNLNIVSAALCIFTTGLATCVPAIKTGAIFWTVAAGIMVGFGLALAYLGAQWDQKTKVNLIIGVGAGLVSSGVVIATLISVQGW